LAPAAGYKTTLTYLKLISATEHEAVTSASTAFTANVITTTSSKKNDLIDTPPLPPPLHPSEDITGDHDEKSRSGSSPSTLGPKIMMGFLFGTALISFAAILFCLLNVMGLMFYGLWKCVSLRYRPRPSIDLRRQSDLQRSLNGDIKLEALDCESLA
jgi:hypothetical protein